MAEAIRMSKTPRNPKRYSPRCTTLIAAVLSVAGLSCPQVVDVSESPSSEPFLQDPSLTVPEPDLLAQESETPPPSDTALGVAAEAPRFVAPVAGEVIDQVQDPATIAENLDAAEPVRPPGVEPLAAEDQEEPVVPAVGDSREATTPSTDEPSAETETTETDVASTRDAVGAALPASSAVPADPEVNDPALGASPALQDARGEDSEPPATPKLVAIRKETWVFDKPNWSSRRIGYLRAGAIVDRGTKPVGNRGCKKGWYRIVPEGYVCVGKTASLDLDHDVARAAAVRPDRSRGLPYPYVMSEAPPPPLYVRLPTEGEQRTVEGDIQKFKFRNKSLASLESVADAIPSSLLDNRSLPSPYASTRALNALHIGRPAQRSGFGLLHVFSWTDRLFGVTTELSLIPLDRTRPIEGSSLRGLHLVEDMDLPIALVQSRYAHQYRIDMDTHTVQSAGPVAYREGFSLTGRRVRVGEHVYLETRDGTYLRENNRVTVLPTIKQFPSWATAGRKWISVSITRQALVAFEGTRPVFATLVSTGADGLGDPKETYSTVLGAYLINTKHVTKTMSRDEVGDAYDLHDVPYVQYFHEGYALHAAYWHDGFGTPRSHGCINLSPYDAAWLFAWTEPQVPDGWHGKLQLKGGTLIHIHP